MRFEKTLVYYLRKDIDDYLPCCSLNGILHYLNSTSSSLDYWALRSNKSSKDIFIPVNNQKWKALRQLKKARIETGLYEEKRKKVEAPVKTSLKDVAEKESVSFEGHNRDSK